MDAKQKAISLFNENMNLAHGCFSGDHNGGCTAKIKCLSGVCNIELYECKRISIKMAKEVLSNIDSEEKKSFWNDVIKELKNI